MATNNPGELLAQLAAVIEQRKQADPGSSYVAQLFAKGRSKIAQKVGEEGVEVALAAVSGDNVAIVSEMADLWFHSMVLLADAGLSHQAVLDELGERFGLSGLEEKASRPQSIKSGASKTGNHKN
ncbi:phosphoribosyl-ATP diphosphatase [Halothiobacillus neapolitanus]|uniref:Phosphoribosyl-ATP pyrophosphatase n=1 Tax=Halothiobacillus neapolitanus (strain ATCC 23641 / DSM 15147 / CIP 104769 / NCIMB 8539 / c2) TaxID=555778 RepID=D0KWI3_HALNC|nr:phosphoribosyl-ATP diphosphatase [Halothiobacillus neapolitanus]ACX94980.1 phosphoribosyl-ATP diphosphatase [Halothiobacillus neapolitanus c2]TDN61068.1 phosphoribosyl-ATP pyrophosphatase [Halothiobacillus neapolitanus]